MCCDDIHARVVGLSCCYDHTLCSSWAKAATKSVGFIRRIVAVVESTSTQSAVNLTGICCKWLCNQSTNQPTNVTVCSLKP